MRVSMRKGKNDEIDDEKFSISFEKELAEGEIDSASEADELFSIDAAGKDRSPSPIISKQPLPLHQRHASPSSSKQYGADRTQKVIVPPPTESGNKILEVRFCFANNLTNFANIVC